MKNVKLFCQIAMHIKTVKRCNVSNGCIPVTGSYSSYEPDAELCLIGNAFKAKLITNNGEARQLAGHSRSMWMNVFGVMPQHSLLWPGIERPSGTAYYKECVKFLQTNKVLSVLRRMENQAKAA